MGDIQITCCDDKSELGAEVVDVGVVLPVGELGAGDSPCI